MKNLSSVSNAKDITTKEYVDNGLNGKLNLTSYIEFQPEANLAMSGLCNDLAGFYEKGGTCDAYEYDADFTPGNIPDFTPLDLSSHKTSRNVIQLNERVFDGSLGYAHGDISGDKYLIWDLDLRNVKNFSYTTRFFWSFGSASWYYRYFNVLKLLNNGTSYTSFSERTNGQQGWVFCNTNASRVIKLRIVFVPCASGNSRIAQFGLLNYSSDGLNETFMSRTRSDNDVYRSINPAKNNAYSLGADGKYWNSIRTNKLYNKIYKEPGERCIIHISAYSYSTLCPNNSSDSRVFYTALLKKLCIDYPNYQYARFVGVVTPGSIEQVSIMIYDTSIVDSSTGLPQYASGYAVSYSGEKILSFGTKQYVFNIGTVYSELYKPSFSVIQNKPTTLSGYGITDGALKNHTHTKSQITDFAHTHTCADITDKLTAGGTTDIGYGTESNREKVPTIARLAFWNGAYSSSNNSNLLYTAKGALGTACTKDIGYFVTKGNLTDGSITTLKIGGATLTWDSANNCLRCDKAIVSAGSVTAGQ